MAMRTPTADRVRELFAFDSSTGILTRRTKASSNAEAGAVAGHLSKGYLLVNVDGIKQKVHRIAWLHHYGEWPPGMIDHINGNRSDNRIANLRVASAAINAQ